jgi:Tol biopolymer transport system component
MVSGGLYAISENGGPPRQLCTRKNRPFLIASHPVRLPDGDSFLFTAWTTQAIASGTLAIGSTSNGSCQALDLPAVDVVGYRNGIAYYVTAEGTLMGIAFDARAKRSEGSPVPLLSDIDVNQTTGLANIAMSDDGSIVYSSGLKPTSVVVVDQKGSAQSLVPDMLAYSYPRFSPDGNKIALTVASPGQRDILVYDIPSKTSTKITAAQEASVNERPEWTPDGRRIVFRSSRGKRSGIWWRPVDLSELETPLFTRDTEDYYEAVVTPDGRGIVYQLDTAGADVLYKTIGDNSPPRPIAATSAIESQARVSSDGRWVAFVSNESGRDEVLVQPLAGGSRTQISLNGGREPVWSRDGRYIYYRDDDDHFVRATLTTNPGIVVTSRDAMFDDTFLRAPFHANFDVAPDGTHFLFLKSTEAPELMVVHNWIGEAEAKLKKQ